MRKYFVAPRVGVVEREAEIFAARLPDGPVLQLDGSAAVIWREAVSADDGEIVDRVACAMGVRPSDVAADVEAFISTLLHRRLLISRPGERY